MHIKNIQNLTKLSAFPIGILVSIRPITLLEFRSNLGFSSHFQSNLKPKFQFLDCNSIWQKQTKISRHEENQLLKLLKQNKKDQNFGTALVILVFQEIKTFFFFYEVAKDKNQRIHYKSFSGSLKINSKHTSDFLPF